MNVSAALLCDFYKICHREMQPDKTEVVYATWTPRESRLPNVTEIVGVGPQVFVKEWLIDYFNENFFSRPKQEVVAEYARIIKFSLNVAAPATAHIEDLHDLGYLPLLIKALPEGTLIPLKVPAMTIQNTDHRFFWLPTYIETLASCELWPIYTGATIAREYRKVLDFAAMKTVGDTLFVPFQGHDFSMRGMMGVKAAIKTGMGHLFSFSGTDTIPAICGMEYFYGANVEKELVGTSIAATEHGVECVYKDDLEYFEQVLKIHPNGFVSAVSDGRDFWDVIGRIIPMLKDRIMARDGRLVIRPDSGDPVLIICGDPNGKTELERKGAVEALWDIFGGTVTGKGYKLLDSHIGLIYGDAITLWRAQEIVNRLADKGFASINVVFGIGSYTYQYNTRDTLGFALKSTSCIVDGKERQVFKDPKTDNGVKKSQKGRVGVYKDNGVVKFVDGLSEGSTIPGDMLQIIFLDGVQHNLSTFAEVKSRLSNA